MAIEIERLKSLPYFSGLNSTELESIRKFIFERVAERNELITIEGEHSEALYFVVSGAAKVFKTSVEGKEQILQIIRPGDSFNDVPPLYHEPNLASAQAMGPVLLYGIRKVNLETILEVHPRVAINIIMVLAQRVRHLTSLVEDFSFRHVVGRVARILLEYAEDGKESPRRLTQYEMAAMVGTAREMIGRTLKTLEEEGTIRIDRHRIVIVNKNGLKAKAGAFSEIKVTDSNPSSM